MPQHVYLTNASYVSSAALIKLSILFQFLRLFSESSSSISAQTCRNARRTIWALIVIVGLWGFIFMMLAWFSCHPVQKWWQPYLPGKCIGWGTKNPDQFFSMFVGHASSNMALDLIVLAVPLPFLRAIQLGVKSKAGFISLYSLGCM